MYKFRANIKVTDTEDGLVVLDQKLGNYWSLNGSGAEIAKQLENGLSPEAIAALLADRYGVAKIDVEKDIKNLIEQLISVGLLEEIDT